MSEPEEALPVGRRVLDAAEGDMADASPVAPARFSLVLPQAFPGVDDDDVPGVIERAVAEHGFDVVELTPAAGSAARRAIHTSLERAGVQALFLAGLPLLRAGVALCSAGEDRRRAIAVVRETIEQACEAGADAVLVTSGRADDPRDRRAALSRLVDSLTELAEFAADVAPELRLRLEPTDTELQHRQLIGATTLARSIVEHVGDRGSALDLNLDLSHLLELGEQPAQSLAHARPHCRHVHLANCVLEGGHPLRGDRHPPFGHPGSLVGVPEIAETLRSLDRLGYLTPEVVIGLEVTPLPGHDPWATLATAVAAVRTARGLAARRP
jgi:sugar phosphate isomerase/epimerase